MGTCVLFAFEFNGTPEELRALNDEMRDRMVGTSIVRGNDDWWFKRYGGYPKGVLHVDVWDHVYSESGSQGKRYTAKWPNHRAVLSMLFDWQDEGRIGRVWHYDDCAFWDEEWGVPGVYERPSSRDDLLAVDAAWAAEFGHDIV